MYFFLFPRFPVGLLLSFLGFVMNDHGLEDYHSGPSQVGFERHRTRQQHNQRHHHHHTHSQLHLQQDQQQEARTSRRQRSTSAGRSRQPVFQVCIAPGIIRI